MTLAQMEAIATDLDKRVQALEGRREPASFAPQNTYIITNEGDTIEKVQEITVEELALMEGEGVGGTLIVEKEELFFVTHAGAKHKVSMGGGGAELYSVGLVLEIPEAFTITALDHYLIEGGVVGGKAVGNINGGPVEELSISIAELVVNGKKEAAGTGIEIPAAKAKRQISLYTRSSGGKATEPLALAGWTRPEEDPYWLRAIKSAGNELRYELMWPVAPAAKSLWFAHVDMAVTQE